PAQRGGEEGLPAIDDDHRKEETDAAMNVTKCSACDTEYREGAKVCDTCGAKIEPEAETSELQIAVMPAQDEGSVAPANEDAVDPMLGPDASDPAPSADSMEAAG